MTNRAQKGVIDNIPILYDIWFLNIKLHDTCFQYKKCCTLFKKGEAFNFYEVVTNFDNIKTVFDKDQFLSSIGCLDYYILSN